MKRLLALLAILALLLAALPAAGLADMEMDVEESELEDFGEGEGYAAEDTDDEDEDDAEEADDLDDLDEDALGAMEGDSKAFEYDFGGEGYTGSWVEIPGQSMQFCLPEGWKAGDADDDALYTAAKEDGTASLAIYLKGKDVDDLDEWMEDNMAPGEEGELKSVGFYSALTFHGEANRLNVYIVTDGGKLLQFAFDRKTEEDLAESFALNIVSSLYEDWFDDEELMEEMEAEAAQ